MRPLKIQVQQTAIARTAHKVSRKGPRQNIASPSFDETGRSCQLPEMELGLPFVSQTVYSHMLAVYFSFVILLCVKVLEILACLR